MNGSVSIEDFIDAAIIEGFKNVGPSYMQSLEESLEKLVGKSQEQIRIDKKFEDLEMEEELARLKKGKSHGSAGSLKNPKSLPLS